MSADGVSKLDKLRIKKKLYKKFVEDIDWQSYHIPTQPENEDELDGVFRDINNQWDDFKDEMTSTYQSIKTKIKQEQCDHKTYESSNYCGKGVCDIHAGKCISHCIDCGKDAPICCDEFICFKRGYCKETHHCRKCPTQGKNMPITKSANKT